MHPFFWRIWNREYRVKREDPEGTSFAVSKERLFSFQVKDYRQEKAWLRPRINE
jgi:hypothetical protein